METMISSDTLAKKVIDLQPQIGNTPLHSFDWLSPNPNVSILAKKEWLQLSGSVKARAAYAIFRAAIEEGSLGHGKILLDATSGNTGIAYAHIGKKIGIPVTLCLPENVSRERKEILRSLGVELIFTSRFDNTDGSQQVARAMAEKNPDRYFYADQYRNENNWKAHYYHTAPEIFSAVPGITHFVAGLGTTGTFIGTARRLRKFDPAIRMISLQPESALHGLEGWKHLETAIVPAFYDPAVADEHFEIATEEAYDIIAKVERKEGMILSPSAAANLAGAIRVAGNTVSGTIVTVLPDNGDKYSEILKKILTK